MNDLFEEAKLMYLSGSAEAAEAAYRRLLEQEPDHYRAYCNLGCLLEDQGRLVDAQKCLMQAIAIKPDEAFLHYNLAHVMHQQERLEAAVAAYQKALELNPAMTAAHYNLGTCLDKLGRLDEAAASFELATHSDSASAPAFAKLAGTLKALKRHDAAITAYQRSLTLDPGNHSIAFQLGRLFEITHRDREAEAAYRLVLEHNPASVLARESLALIQHHGGDTHAALAVLQEGLGLQPDQPQLKHIFAALGGASTPDRASDAYVSTLFDRFAEDFDQVLERLRYQAPQLVTDALAAVVPDAAGDLDILDGGCGTGLCGPLLKPYARHLAGVDLSTGMLEKARERGVYDELIATELTAHLQAIPASLDVIIAADTLIYFGDLGPVLHAACTALRPNGLLIFTLEESQTGNAEADYTLHPHGRYSHTRRYLCDALAGQGLDIITLEEGFLRTQSSLPVVGLVCTSRTAN